MTLAFSKLSVTLSLSDDIIYICETSLLFWGSCIWCVIPALPEKKKITWSVGFYVQLEVFDEYQGGAVGDLQGSVFGFFCESQWGPV